MAMPKISKEIYINKFNEIHNFKYDYSESILNTLQDKFEYECNIHGTRSQFIKNHLDVGCSACLRDKKTEEKHINFINKCNEKFKDYFTYNKVKYLNNKTNVTVTCKYHGDISVVPSTFLNSLYGCNQCSWKHGGITNRLNKDEMIIKANQIHRK